MDPTAQHVTEDSATRLLSNEIPDLFSKLLEAIHSVEGRKCLGAPPQWPK